MSDNAINAELSEQVRQLTKLLDDQLGTPCEQIRHRELVAELVAALEGLIEWFSDSVSAPVSDADKAAVERARAIITKATAET